jgi:hypothetical protein
MALFYKRAGFDSAARARIMGGNAARFLGLAKSEQTRRRIADWHVAKGLDPSCLNAFDDVAFPE